MSDGKVCNKCGLVGKRFYERRGVCTSCMSIRSKTYHENNKEKVALRKKTYRKNNKEKVALRKKIYRKNNIESIKLSEKTYRANNKEKVSLREKAYREKNKEAFAFSRSTLSKQYTSSLLVCQGWKREALSDEIIEVKRLTVLIKRQMRRTK